MNKDVVAGNWMQFKGKVIENWGKLTDDDWTVAAGNRDQIVGKLQERYGLIKEDAERQFQEFEQRVHQETK